MMSNQGEGTRAIARKFHTSASTLAREFGLGESDTKRPSTRGARSKEKDLKPLTRKQPQVLISERNAPAVVDMHLSFAEAMAKMPLHELAYTDECPIPYGQGQHGRTGRAPQGEPVVFEKPYRWKMATLCMAVNQFDIVKAVVNGGSWGGSMFRNFVLEHSAEPGDYPNLGGPPLSATLKSRGQKVLLYDMLGRSGKKKAPTAQHFHPDLVPKLAEHGVLGMLGPPKFGIQDPIELINGLIQDKVGARASPPLASATDAPGLSCKTRRYASGRVARRIASVGSSLDRKISKRCRSP